ncbi:MAG: flagellar basal body-associated FliL family protein [Panacagrimonas sp.]
MASAADTAESPRSEAAPLAKKRGISLGVLIGAILLSMAVAGGGAWFVFGRSVPAANDHEDAAGESGQETAELPAMAVYLALDPGFVVNLEDPEVPRYLQTEVQFMARDAHELESVKAHVPRIRNSLLMLFGQQKPADLATREGKEKLQLAALAEVQKVMQAEIGKPVVEAVYFTSFVMQ